jgi:hypothetical protein
VELFPEQSETGDLLDVDVDTTPTEVVDSSIQATTDNQSSRVAITLSFFDM